MSSRKWLHRLKSRRHARPIQDKQEDEHVQRGRVRILLLLLTPRWKMDQDAMLLSISPLQKSVVQQQLPLDSAGMYLPVVGDMLPLGASLVTLLTAGQIRTSTPSEVRQDVMIISQSAIRMRYEARLTRYLGKPRTRPDQNKRTRQPFNQGGRAGHAPNKSRRRGLSSRKWLRGLEPSHVPCVHHVT